MKSHTEYTLTNTHEIFTLEGGILFKSSDTGILVEKQFSEKLMVEAILNFQEHAFNFSIFNEEKKLLKEFNDKVIDVCKEKDLIGFDDLELKIRQQRSFFNFHRYYKEAKDKSISKTVS